MYIKDLNKYGKGENANTTRDGNTITFNTQTNWQRWSVVHELGHAWDFRNGGQLSTEMANHMGASFLNYKAHQKYPSDPNYWYDPGFSPPPCGVDDKFISEEDFFEAVAAYVYGYYAGEKAAKKNYPYNDPNRDYSYASYYDTPRGQYIHDLIANYQ